MTTALLRPLAPIGALLALMLAPAPLAAKDRGVWREAFQSSPARYAPLPPAFLAAAARQYKVPLKVIEDNTVPRAATGTLRFRFAVSAGGSQIRLRFSNEESDTPLVVAAASLGLAGKGFAAEPGSLRPLTFGGRPDAVIPPGAVLVSDPVAMPVQPGRDLLASLSTPDTVPLDPRGGAMIAVAPAGETLRDTMSAARPMPGRPVVTGAEVLAPQPLRVVVTLGDSITDGNRTDATALRGWPAELAIRLAARQARPGYAVVNAGIGGNRLLGTGWGPAALARFDRDVLRIEGVSHLVILEGTNDIGMSGPSLAGDAPLVSAEALIGAYRQLIARAYARGIKVALGTILPFGGAPSHYSEDKERVRQAVNRWIREAGESDTVIDFDLIARDPANPRNMRKDFGSTDGLHPGEAGYKAMGDAIDLSIFR